MLHKLTTRMNQNTLTIIRFALLLAALIATLLLPELAFAGPGGGSM